MALKDLSDDLLYPLVRFGRSQYTVPKGDVEVGIKKRMHVTVDEFKSFMGAGTSPSRSPSVWRPYLNAFNLAFVKFAEGVYPLTCFDVEDHPQMSNCFHFVPADVAKVLIPEIQAEAQADPAKYGFKLDSGTEESKVKYQKRLDALAWVPTDCQTENNKAGVLKPTVPSPQTNKWSTVATAKHVVWCCTPPKRKTQPPANGKRKLEEFSMPAGVRVKTDLGFDGVRMIASIDVGEDFTHHVSNGVLKVVVYGQPQEEEGEEAAGDVDDE